MEHYSAAWNEVKENLGGWAIFSVVFIVLCSFAIGVLLVPNALRATRDALANNTAPEIGALFNFDNIAEDAIGMVIFLIAMVVGSLVVVGGMIASVLLIWVAPLLAEKRVAGAESWKASLAHAKGNFVEILIFGLIGGALTFVGLITCGLGLLVTVPVIMVATWKYYESNRAQILQSAQADGVALLQG